MTKKAIGMALILASPSGILLAMTFGRVSPKRYTTKVTAMEVNKEIRLSEIKAEKKWRAKTEARVDKATLKMLLPIKTAIIVVS